MSIDDFVVDFLRAEMYEGTKLKINYAIKSELWKNAIEQTHFSRRRLPVC